MKAVTPANQRVEEEWPEEGLREVKILTQICLPLTGVGKLEVGFVSCSQPEEETTYVGTCKGMSIGELAEMMGGSWLFGKSQCWGRNL